MQIQKPGRRAADRSRRQTKLSSELNLHKIEFAGQHGDKIHDGWADGTVGGFGIFLR
jgi:hypothetical protein